MPLGPYVMASVNGHCALQLMHWEQRLKSSPQFRTTCSQKEGCVGILIHHNALFSYQFYWLFPLRNLR